MIQLDSLFTQQAGNQFLEAERSSILSDHVFDKDKVQSVDGSSQSFHLLLEGIAADVACIRLNEQRLIARVEARAEHVA